MRFKMWLENKKENDPVVFCDLDETLVHKVEEGWIKESKRNSNYLKMLVPGDPPYKDVKKIHDDGKTFFIFPRPGATNFLKKINKFADVYILTHSQGNFAEKCLDALDLTKYIKEVYHCGKQKPDSLAKKYDLGERRWVLVDNMPVDSLEMINKLRVLGLVFPELSPKEESRQILVASRDHFVHVDDWIPTAYEYDDFALWGIIPKIETMLGVENTKQ